MLQSSDQQVVYKTVTVAAMWRSSRALISYLLRKWWIIVLVCFIGGVTGFLIAWFEKPKYESHLTFALDDGAGGLGGAISLAAEFGFNLGGSKNLFEGDNILTLLTSRRIVERVLLSVDTVNGKATTMADYYTRVSTDSTKKKSQKALTPTEIRLSKVSFPAAQPRETFSYLQDSVLMNLYREFAINGALNVGKPDKKLNLYEVTVVSPDERFSKVFTDKLIKQATDFYVELKTSKSKATLEILEARVNQTRGAINTAIDSRADIQDANLNPAFQQAQAQLQRKQVDISAYGGAYGELYKNLELARYQYLKDIPLLQIIDGADYPMTRIKKGKLLTAIAFSIVFGFLVVLVLSIFYYVKKNDIEKEVVYTV
ncbi:hypothetical protein BH10BAC3_BH10BAC3_24420 [soil metagenome]